MSRIDISSFQAAIPLIDPQLLPPENAADLLDCDLTRGTLAPVRNDLLIATPISPDTESIYFTGSTWYQWPGLVDVARAFDDISSKRIVYTGNGYPKESDEQLGTGFRRNGLPAPSAAPGILQDGTDEEEELGRYSWCYTYFYERPDQTIIESPPSPPTAIITWMTGKSVTLTDFAYPDPGVPGCEYTGIRIYRLQASETGASYHLVKEQLSLDDWVDSVADIDATANPTLETMDTSTGATVSWDMPIDDLSGITNVDFGFFVGFSGNKVYPSVQFVSYAFPGKYSLSTDSKIKGLGYTGAAVVILTEANPYILSGQDPSILSSRRLNYSRPCSGTTRSIVSTPGGVLFPSPEGLAMIDPAGNDALLSNKIMTEEQWAAVNPASLISFLYRGKYVGFEAGTANIHIIDLSKARYEKAQAAGIVRGAFQKKEDGSIYLVVDKSNGRELREWRGGSIKPYMWTSKVFADANSRLYTRANVLGDFSGGASSRLTITADGVTRNGIDISSPGVVNLGRIKAKNIQITFAGTAKIKRVILANSVRGVLV